MQTCRHALSVSRFFQTLNRHSDKRTKTQNQRNSHLRTLNAARHILCSKHPLLTKTTCGYKAKMSAATCVFIISKCTQLLASNVAGEQCWQLHTFSTRDTLREIVGGTGPLTLQTSPWCMCMCMCILLYIYLCENNFEGLLEG